MTLLCDLTSMTLPLFSLRIRLSMMFPGICIREVLQSQIASMTDKMLPVYHVLKAKAVNMSQCTNAHLQSTFFCPNVVKAISLLIQWELILS